MKLACVPLFVVLGLAVTTTAASNDESSSETKVFHLRLQQRELQGQHPHRRTQQQQGGFLNRIINTVTAIFEDADCDGKEDDVYTLQPNLGVGFTSSKDVASYASESSLTALATAMEAQLIK